jgi:oligopeptidase B
MIYEEKDEKFRVGFWRGSSERFLYFYSASTLTTEVYYLDADTPENTPTVISPRHDGMEYWPEDHEDSFIILTNDCDDSEGNHTNCALNNKVVRTPILKPNRTNWIEEIPHREDVQILSVESYKAHWVLSERANGLDQFRVIDFKKGTDYIIPLPEPAYVIWGNYNPNFETRSFRFGYSSLVSPPSTYELDLDTGNQTLLKERPVKNYDRTLYTSDRINYPSHDGTLIPVSIVYRSDIDRSKPQALYLYGYGSYGSSMDPYFSSSRLSLLDRGVIFAMAHVRGGGEMGRQWYEDGKFLNKKNTFLDFIAASEGLIQEKYTSPDKLAIIGGSAGGLLIGASINMRPELFHAAVADVPFVDVVTTMFDENIPLTTEEWEEWGNPQEREYFDYMLSYSPYDNVIEQDYPHLLVTSGLNDPRVQYWEPTKWVAKLRDNKTDTNQLLLRTNMGAGHGGNSGRYGYLKDIAFEYAFLLEKWDLAY